MAFRVICLWTLIGLTCSSWATTSNTALPKEFLGIFRNPRDKANHVKAMSTIIDMSPANLTSSDGNFLHFQKHDGGYLYCVVFFDTGSDFVKACVQFKLGEKHTVPVRDQHLEVLFELSSPSGSLTGTIKNLDKPGNPTLNLFFTAKDEGLQVKFSTADGSEHTAFYTRSLWAYMQGFFEIDPVRTGSENVSIANTIFHSFGEIYTVTNSTLLRITKMFAKEEGYGYSQVFHPAYQMGVSFVLNKIYSAHSAMFNGTLEHHFSLENSTPSSALLTGRFKLPDGKGTFTTYMLFEGSSVQQTIKFNDKETTIFYTRTIPDWFYGAFEEVGEQDYARERFVDHAKNPDKPCPAKSGGLRLNISRSPDTREFILTMAPCEGAEPAAIPFKLNGTTELNDYNHLYSSLKATTFIKSRGSLLVDLTYTPRNSVSEAQKVSLDLTMAPFDPSTGISCVAFDGRSTRAIRMRRLFSPLMFGKFENAETPTTVLQIAPVNSTHFTQTITLRDSVTKESFAFNTPTKVLLEGANHPLIRHYFEHSGNGRPTLMTLTFHPPPPGAVVGKLRHANVKVFRAEGVDVYQNAIDTHKHSQQFYARKSS